MFETVQAVGMTALMYMPGLALLAHGVLAPASSGMADNQLTTALTAAGRPWRRVGVRLASGQPSHPVFAVRLPDRILVLSACLRDGVVVRGPVWSAAEPGKGGIDLPDACTENRMAVDAIRRSAPGIAIDGLVVTSDDAEFYDARHNPAVRPPGVVTISEFQGRLPQLGTGQDSAQVESGWRRIGSGARGGMSAPRILCIAAGAVWIGFLLFGPPLDELIGDVLSYVDQAPRMRRR